MTSLRVYGLVLVTTVGLGGAARADEFSLHATLATFAAASDNSFSDPEGMVSGGDAVINYQVRPGGLFTYHSHRAMHELGVDAGIDGVGFDYENLSVTGRAGWRATYMVSPLVDTEAGAGASAGRVNALASATAPNLGTGPGVVPTGNPEFFGADASQALSYRATPLLTLRQDGFARLSRTDAEPEYSRGYEVGGALNAYRTFKVTALGIRAQASWQRLQADMMGLVVDRDQLDVRGTANIRRDFSRHWSAAIEGGAVMLYPLAEGEKRVIQPLGSLDVMYFPEWGSAGLQIRHNVAPNLFLAQNEITDSATLTMALPLPYFEESRAMPRMTLLGAGGYARTRFIDAMTADTRLTFDVITADLAVTYAPRRNMTVSARIQFARQSSPDGPAVNNQLGFLRNAFIISFYGRWPDRVAAEMPPRSNRVRARDLTPVGDETTRGIDGVGGAEPR